MYTIVWSSELKISFYKMYNFCNFSLFFSIKSISLSSSARRMLSYTKYERWDLYFRRYILYKKKSPIHPEWIKKKKKIILYRDIFCLVMAFDRETGNNLCIQKMLSKNSHYENALESMSYNNSGNSCRMKISMWKTKLKLFSETGTYTINFMN